MDEFKKVEKRAAKFLPRDLQVALDTFIEQFNIMVEYDLAYIPWAYTKNLLTTMSNYPEYNNVLLELMDILKLEKKNKRKIKLTE